MAEMFFEMEIRRLLSEGMAVVSCDMYNIRKKKTENESLTNRFGFKIDVDASSDRVCNDQ